MEINKIILGLLSAAITGLSGIVISICVYVIDPPQNELGSYKHIIAYIVLILASIGIIFCIGLIISTIIRMCRVAKADKLLKAEDSLFLKELELEQERIFAGLAQLGACIVHAKIKQNAELTQILRNIVQESIKQNQNIDIVSLNFFLQQLSASLDKISQQNIKIEQEIMDFLNEMAHHQRERSRDHHQQS